MCKSKNAGVAGYAEAFRPVQSDSQTSEWYSYFENDVRVLYHLSVEASMRERYSKKSTKFRQKKNYILTFCFLSTILLVIKKQL